MAKAQPIEDLDCEAQASIMASKVLRIRFDEMLEFHAAATGPDGVDGVHDMRVASRRFRSALRDFAHLFEKKAVKPVKRDAKAIADSLGDVRDGDVAIEALEKLRERAPADEIAAGIERLIDRRRNQRAIAHSAFVRDVTPELLESVAANMEQAFREGPSKNETTLRSFAIDAIERSHEKFLGRAESIYEPFNDTSLHKLRLSGKRLRYALELFDRCWSGELKPFAKYVSKLQSSLGQVHDSDAWIQNIQDDLAKNILDRRTAAWLISEFMSLRTAEYLKALGLWTEWHDAELSARLRGIIVK
jgi:CHAD domain-containing protein